MLVVSTRARILFVCLAYRSSSKKANWVGGSVFVCIADVDASFRSQANHPTVCLSFSLFVHSLPSKKNRSTKL